jgi:hypothetical protein
MTVKEKYDLSLIVNFFIVTAICGTCLYCSGSGNWKPFVVCAPFALGLVPGYLNLLPKGGMRHGRSCDCLEPDEGCEFGFWFEIAQKGSLFIPMILGSIFMQCFVENGVIKALSETSLAALTIVAYSLACVIGINMLVSQRRR